MTGLLHPAHQYPFASIASPHHLPPRKLSNLLPPPPSSLDSLHLESPCVAPESRRWKSYFPSMSCGLCGRKSIVHEDTQSLLLKSKLVLCCDDTSDADMKAGTQQPQQSGWRDCWRLPGRRRKANACTDALTAGDEVYSKSPRWKQLLRKIRAEARKVNCRKQDLDFHYDALSYAKNFDDGCWQECRSRVSFSAPLVLENQCLKKRAIETSCGFHAPKSIVWRNPSPAKEQHTPSIWLRRRTTPPPLLDLRWVRSKPVVQRII